MAAFLRVVALLVALGNSYVVSVSLAVEEEQDAFDPTKLSLEPISLLFAAAIFAGALGASEILGRYARGWLEAKGPVRFLALVFGVTLGGLLAGLVLSAGLVVFSGPLEEFERVDVSKDDLTEVAAFTLWSILGGGTVGLLEGLLLGLPLAAILGLFRGRGRS